MFLPSGDVQSMQYLPGFLSSIDRQTLDKLKEKASNVILMSEPSNIQSVEKEKGQSTISLKQTNTKFLQ